MPERVWKCPNCGASLTPSPFARVATCSHCATVVQIDEATVLAARFRAAYDAWNAPDLSRGDDWFTVGGDVVAWRRRELVAHGEIADVYRVERSRLPPQRALLKVLRDPADQPMLESEWRELAALEAGSSSAAHGLLGRVPRLIAHGVIQGGPHAGTHASLLDDAPGFEHTLEAVRAALPGGVGGHAGVWIWRRLLEILHFLHASGTVHGAVLPPHLLVERGEHGLRLVGFGCAGSPGDGLKAVVTRYERFYPAALLSSKRLDARHDVEMSARTVAFALGADDSGRMPATVPPPLRQLLEAAIGGHGSTSAWSLRERVGQLAAKLFGPPSFHPISIPGG